MEGHKKFVHYHGLKLKVPYGMKWLTAEKDGTIKVWHQKPNIFFDAWFNGEGYEVVAKMDDIKKLDWRKSLTEIEYKTQRDQVFSALQKPMTVIKLFNELDHISPDVIAPIVTNLYTDGYVFKIGKQMEKWKNTTKEHYVYSSLEEDKHKDARYGQVMQGVYSTLIGVKPPPPELCKGKTVHACNDDEF